MLPDRPHSSYPMVCARSAGGRIGGVALDMRSRIDGWARLARRKVQRTLAKAGRAWRHWPAAERRSLVAGLQPIERFSLDGVADVGTAGGEQNYAENQQAQQRQRVVADLQEAVTGVAEEDGAGAQGGGPPRATQ